MFILYQGLKMTASASLLDVLFINFPKNQHTDIDNSESNEWKKRYSKTALESKD